MRRVTEEKSSGNAAIRSQARISQKKEGGKGMNRMELKAEIVRSGMSNRKVARDLGISEQAFYNKLNGASEFKESEIKKIIKMLNLSSARVNQIFLS